MAFPLGLGAKRICKIILHLTDLVSWVGMMKDLREMVGKKRTTHTHTKKKESKKNHRQNLLKLFLSVKSK